MPSSMIAAGGKPHTAEQAIDVLEAVTAELYPPEPGEDVGSS